MSSADANFDVSNTDLAIKRIMSNHALSAQLRLHLETGDYFAVLATIFGFFEDICADHEKRGYETRPLTSQEVKKLRDGLIYLNANYKILPKEVRCVID